MKRNRQRESPLIDRREHREPEARPVLVRRPKIRYRVVRPYGPFVRGQVIEPTGLYRDTLIARGLIERFEE